MKKIIRYFSAILPALVATLIVYGFIGFINLNWNVFLWTKGDRIGLVVFNAIMWFFSYLMLGFRDFLDKIDKK